MGGACGLQDPDPPEDHPGEDSCVFGGESGSLDHALVPASTAPKVTGVDIWGTHAAESTAYQYDGVPAL